MMEPKLSWSVEKVARLIDDTEVTLDAPRSRITAFCESALQHSFRAACVLPIWVNLAADIVRGSNTAVAATVGTFGDTLPTLTVAIRDCIARGADEFDVLISLGALKSGDWETVARYMRCAVEAADGRSVKLMLEMGLLTEAEKARACELSVETGISCVKTSTGRLSSGATVEDVSLMRRIVGDRLDVKASGGIRTFQDVVRMVEAGASRIGTSRGAGILATVPTQ